MTRKILGLLAVALLRLTARLPLRLAWALGALLLPCYRPFRRGTCARLHRLGIAPGAYYRTRLRLALLSLRHLMGRSDGLRVRVEGGELYEAALATGRPVALFGWHQGPVEMLHRVPSRAAARAFFVMTAGAFSPVLARLMLEGRASQGKAVIRPDSLTGLRAWERDKGVLAVMIDQVRGRPEEWLTVHAKNGATVHVPWPKRLMEWVIERRPEMLAVSVELRGRTVRFRYLPVEGEVAEEVKADLARKMEAALREAPRQYNWSYPKVKAE